MQTGVLTAAHAAREDSKTAWLKAVRRHQFDLDAPGSPSFWSPQLDTLPRHELQMLQSDKLRAAYRYLFDHSSFYRAKFSAAGLGRDAVQSIEDLPRVPLTTRDEWLHDQSAHPPWGTFSPLAQADWVDHGWMLFTTSGTSAAQPRVFRHTTFDRELWSWLGARALYAMGVRRGDIAINCFGYGTSVAFWGLHYALNRMGVPVIPGGGANTERRGLFIERYKPTVVLCTPSYALHLGHTMRERGMDPAASSIRVIVAAGEPGSCIPATKRRIERLWNATLHDDFGCTEVAMSPLGYTCEHQARRTQPPISSHLMEDAYVVEVLDKTTLQPVPDGERGILVVSNLFSEAQPMLRYVMGDFIALSHEPCPCGRTGALAVGGLQGRSDDLIKIRGLLFYPSAIEDSIRQLDEVGDEFKVELTSASGMDRVRVTVEPASPIPKDDYAKPQDRVARALKGSLGIDVEVEMLPYGTLPRTEFKAKRLFDRRSAKP